VVIVGPTATGKSELALDLADALTRREDGPAAGVGVEGGAPPGHRAGVGGEHAHDDAHGGGLPRAVGADEADELIVSHGQGEGVEGLDAPESFGQMTDFQYEISGALGGGRTLLMCQTYLTNVGVSNVLDYLDVRSRQCDVC